MEVGWIKVTPKGKKSASSPGKAYSFVGACVDSPRCVCDDDAVPIREHSRITTELFPVALPLVTLSCNRNNMDFILGKLPVLL